MEATTNPVTHITRTGRVATGATIIIFHNHYFRPALVVDQYACLGTREWVFVVEVDGKQFPVEYQEGEGVEEVIGCRLAA